MVYLALEGGSGFHARIEAWRRRHLKDHAKPVPFYLIDVSLKLIADHNALIADVRAQLGDTAPAAVVIDTLNRSLDGSENDDEDMGNYIRAADAVRKAFNCLVPIVHHCGTAGNRPRGHTSLTGADDAQIAIERDEKTGVITATVEHAKDFEAGAKLAWKLEPVDLGHDDEGDPISSCIIVPTEAAATAPKLSRPAQRALGLLKTMIAKEGVPLPAGMTNVPAGTRGVMQAAWREEFVNTHTAGTTDGRTKAFRRAVADLQEFKLVEFYNDFAWLPSEKPREGPADEPRSSPAQVEEKLPDFFDD